MQNNYDDNRGLTIEIQFKKHSYWSQKSPAVAGLFFRHTKNNHNYSYLIYFFRFEKSVFSYIFIMTKASIKLLRL
jgi:hypothetical protein